MSDLNRKSRRSLQWFSHDRRRCWSVLRLNGYNLNSVQPPSLGSRGPSVPHLQTCADRQGRRRQGSERRADRKRRRRSRLVNGGPTTPSVSTTLSPRAPKSCSGNRACPDGTIKIHSWIELPEGNDWELLVVSIVNAAPGRHRRSHRDRLPSHPASTSTLRQSNPRAARRWSTSRPTSSPRSDTFDRTVRLLGRRVDLRIWPHSYSWNFGDGEAITTSKPGAPYPKLVITHNYLRRAPTGRRWTRPRSPSTGSAAAAWRSVPGSVTIEAAPPPCKRSRPGRRSLVMAGRSRDGR